MEKKSLFQLADEYRAIEDALIDNGGELTEDIALADAQNKAELAAKIDNYGKVLRSLKAKEEAAKNEEKRIKDYKQSAQKGQQTLKEWIKFNMERMEADRIDGDFTKAYFLNRNDYEIDEEIILSKYQTALEEFRSRLPEYVKVELKVDKTALKQECKKDIGLIPEGVYEIHSRSLVVK